MINIKLVGVECSFITKNRVTSGSKWSKFVNFNHARSKQVIFDDITHTFVSGEKVYIDGASGSGKTTFIRMLSGIINPTQGSVEINGSICTYIGGESVVYLKKATVMQNILLNAYRRNVQRESMDDYIRKITKRLKGQLLLDVPVSSLSQMHNKKLRLELNRAAIYASDIMILDGFNYIDLDDELSELIASSKLLIGTDLKGKIRKEIFETTVELSELKKKFN